MNVNENALRSLMEHGGHLDTETTVNKKCVLTVHPHVGLKNCEFDSVHPHHQQPSQVGKNYQATVPDPNAYFHPGQLSASESHTITAAGLTGLMVQKLLNGITLQPVVWHLWIDKNFKTSSWKKRKGSIPTDWGGKPLLGVLHRLNTHKIKLPKEGRCRSSEFSAGGQKYRVGRPDTGCKGGSENGRKVPRMS
ncbi:hypothetical protein B0H10DRAFT_1962906 [Mycena sp. CBHHK59/15]|nr:hypothetical protein B0H10DRAFT_1962906 [Mycena sp. CBHHK59/15]